jgi:hypothetical protein
MKKEVFLNPIIRKCKTCGSEFKISPETQKKLADKGYEYPTHCQDCIDKKNSGYYETCVECGKQFIVNRLEQEQYAANGLEPRKRCWDCKDKQKRGR